MERLAAIDEVFLTIDTPNTRQAIASYCMLDAIPNWEVARSRIDDFVTRFPRAALIAERREQYHIWRNGGRLDPEYHLPVLRLTNVNTRSQFEKAVADEFSQPLNYDRPLWRFTLIIGEPRPFVGILFKLHHAFADGIGGLEMIDWWCSAERQTPIEIRKRDRKSTSAGEPTSQQSEITPPEQGRSRLPLRLFHYFQRPSELWYWLRSFGGAAKHGPLNGEGSPNRAIHTLQLPHSQIRALKRRLAVSGNDLLLGIIASGVGHYARIHASPVSSLRIVVPVSLRKLSARWSLGNHLTAVPVVLPLMRSDSTQLLADDVIDQIRVVSSCMQELKQRGAFATYGRLANAVARLPYWLRKYTCEFQARRTNFICTNMPSSVRERFFYGAKILENYGLAALMQSHGFAIGLITYNGIVNVAVVSDPAIVRDPDSLTSSIGVAMEQLSTYA